MARRYSVTGTDTTAATSTGWGITSTAAIRPRIADLLSSFQGTPADNSAQFQLLRYTAAGTATSVTPVALDSGDPAATATAGKTHSAEPTYTAGSILLDFDQNMRATFRWVAAPMFEFVLPATAANGVGSQCQGIGGSGVTVSQTVLYEE